jgi:hypothetical protein
MTRLLLWFLVLAVCAIAQNKFPPEIVKDRLRDVIEVDPVHYKKDLENDRVRVLRAHLGPSEVVPMHDDRAYMMIAITELHLRLSKPGAKPFDIHMQAGESRFGHADMHSITNIYTKSAEYLVIELKD